MRYQDVVVGVDGSESGWAAVRWAAAEAVRRNVPLRVLAVYHDARLHAARYGEPDDVARLARDHFDQVVNDAVAEARSVEPGVDVTGSVTVGDPAAELVAASRDVDLLVVGSRGLGGFGSLLLGSVGQRVAMHAYVPVVVVRGRADTAAGPVIVGVEDSPNIDRVVEAAFEHARRREVRLIAVHAFAVPVPPTGADTPVPYDIAVARDEASARLAEIIDGWREKYPTVEVETLAGRGTPAAVLTGVSSTAGLVVVGSHGHSALAGTLLGSVGMQMLHHSECPVLIVRPTSA
jgi:nucleotide-binding universal stress UspA family protein